MLGKPDADVGSFSDVYSDKLFFTPITFSEHTEAYKLVQKEMKKAAESNQNLLDQTKERAKILLEQYVKRVDKAYGVEYKVEFVDAK